MEKNDEWIDTGHSEYDCDVIWDEDVEEERFRLAVFLGRVKSGLIEKV